MTKTRNRILGAILAATLLALAVPRIPSGAWAGLVGDALHPAQHASIEGS